MTTRTVDVVIVGASLSAAAAAKRLVDAGLETIVLERKELPRHKICSGILSPRGHRFLLENFGPLPREALHEPTYCRGVTFHFPSMVSLPMDFFGGSTPHLHRKYSDYWAIKSSGAEVHDRTSFAGLEDKGDHVLVHARRQGEPVEYRARKVIGADGPSSLVIRSIYPDYPQSDPLVLRRAEIPRHHRLPAGSGVFPFLVSSRPGALHLEPRARRPADRRRRLQARRQFRQEARERGELPGREARRAPAAAHRGRGLRRELRAVADQPLRVRQGQRADHRPGSRLSQHDRRGHELRAAFGRDLRRSGGGSARCATGRCRKCTGA